MIERAATDALTALLRRNPRAALVFGLAGAAIFSYLGIGCAREYMSFAEAPVPVDIRGAVELSARHHEWVRLEDRSADWGRGFAATARGVPYAVGRAGERCVVVAERSLVFAQVVAGPVTGVVQPLRSFTRARLEESGVRLPEDALCCEIATNGRPRNSLIGVIVCAALTVCCFAIYPAILRERRKEREAAARREEAPSA